MTQTHASARAAERPDAPRKSPQAFRTISEVAGDLDVPAHVLRFWESRFTQIRPLKRGGGRRYYRPGDVALLKGIRRLLYSEGMTIKGVQKVMRERGVRFVAELGAGGEALPVATEICQQTAGAVPPTLARARQEPNFTGQKKPLLTPEKRANLEAALSVLNDLRAELSTFAGANGAGEDTLKELA